MASSLYDLLKLTLCLIRCSFVIRFLSSSEISAAEDISTNSALKCYNLSKQDDEACILLSIYSFHYAIVIHVSIYSSHNVMGVEL